jgi:transcriptional regulator GlxA family with amidase domain
VVTAAGVSAGLDCTLWLIARLRDRAAAETAQLSIEYDPRPPFSSGHYSTATPEIRRSARGLLAKALRR